jgi:segregation and condensation protein A
VSTLVADPPAATTPPALVGYQLRLPTFEGPLDVLLRLVERNQLPIADVSLVAVTGQFLAHAAELGGAPPETLAEFAAVGARLVLLKTRALLPRPPADDELEATPSDLVRQLTEYQRIKEVALSLAARDREGIGAFGRGAVVALPAPPVLAPLAAHQPASLARALRRRLTALAPPVRSVVSRPTLTLREMVERVLGRLSGRQPLRFRAVLSPDADCHEVLIAFLAVLALVRRRTIDAEQSELFGEITLRRVETEDASEAQPLTHEFAADD